MNFNPLFILLVSFGKDAVKATLLGTLLLLGLCLALLGVLLNGWIVAGSFHNTPGPLITGGGPTSGSGPIIQCQHPPDAQQSLPPDTPYGSPLAGGPWIITQGFGPTYYSFEPAYGGYPHFHLGIDLAGGNQPATIATMCGFVAFAGTDTTYYCPGLGYGFGNYVKLTNGPYTLIYGHQSVLNVHTGQIVGRGSQLGNEGSTGCSSGQHLHYQIELFGVPQNPLNYACC